MPLLARETQGLPSALVFIIIIISSGFVITHIILEKQKSYGPYLLAVTCFVGFFADDLLALTLGGRSFVDAEFAKVAADVAASNHSQLPMHLLAHLNYHRLRALLKRIEFEKLRRDQDGPRVFIGATNVRSGLRRVFDNSELSVDALLASACLPLAYRAVFRARSRARSRQAHVHLRNVGKCAAEHWLEANLRFVGERSTVDLSGLLPLQGGLFTDPIGIRQRLQTSDQTVRGTH